MLEYKIPLNLPASLKRLFGYVSRRRRRQFLLLFCLTLVGSLAEIISLGSVIPFIGILTQPEKIFSYTWMAGFIRVLGVTSPSDLVLPLSVVFVVAALFAGGIRLFLAWVSIRLANVTGTDIGINVYRRTLYQPYRVHVARNSSEIIASITQNVAATTNILVSLVAIVTSVVLFVSILLTLLTINPMVAVISMISFGAGYGMIAWQTKYRLKRNSQCIAREQVQVVKALQEGLGAIRDVLLDGTQAVYCNTYRRAVQQLQRASGDNSYINQAPRYVMETLGTILLAVLAFVLSRKQGGIGASLPLLGALALGAERLLPLLQQLYANWSYVVGMQASLNNVLDLLDQPLPEEPDQATSRTLSFQNSICFDKVCFRYGAEGALVLDDVNLVISKGARIGFIGSTGSGKSTMLDLLMSLLEPTQGRILVDDQVIDQQIRSSWQRIIAHVPQSIYLADTTVAENIAFGVPANQINMQRLKKAAEQAQISEFIESRPHGYNAIVGERGIRLSGGQRQRIGIARALYKQAKVLVFDEATSALDSATEQEVMSAIENLNRDLTILIIAHRLTTLRDCDLIVKLEGGRVVDQGSYEHFMKHDSGFQNLARVGVVS